MESGKNLVSLTSHTPSSSGEGLKPVSQKMEEFHMIITIPPSLLPLLGCQTRKGPSDESVGPVES